MSIERSGDGHVGHEPSRLRVSDEDRHKVAEILREAAGEGRLDLDELDERLEAAYAAKTYAELVPLTVDLPAHRTAAEAMPLPQREVLPSRVTHDSSWAVMGECKRQGAWLVPEQHTAMAFMGSVTIDLREATFAQPDITVTANAIMGEVKVYVDAFTHVVVSGVPVMGEFHQGKDRTPAQLSVTSPVVRIKGLALMGSVTVERRPQPGTPKKFLGTY